MFRKKNENAFIIHLKTSMQKAFKNGHIPLLYDISQTIIDLLAEADNFRRRNRHIELNSLNSEVSKLTNLYSQVTKLISRSEFSD
jgi:hypothetical protein